MKQEVGVAEHTSVNISDLVNPSKSVALHCFCFPYLSISFFGKTSTFAAGHESFDILELPRPGISETRHESGFCGRLSHQGRSHGSRNVVEWWEL